MNPASDGTSASSAMAPDLEMKEIPQPGQGSVELLSMGIQNLPNSSLRELLQTELEV